MADIIQPEDGFISVGKYDIYLAGKKLTPNDFLKLVFMEDRNELVDRVQYQPFAGTSTKRSMVLKGINLNNIITGPMVFGTNSYVDRDNLQVLNVLAGDTDGIVDENFNLQVNNAGFNGNKYSKDMIKKLASKFNNLTLFDDKDSLPDRMTVITKLCFRLRAKQVEKVMKRFKINIFLGDGSLNDFYDSIKQWDLMAILLDLTNSPKNNGTAALYCEKWKDILNCLYLAYILIANDELSMTNKIKPGGTKPELCYSTEDAFNAGFTTATRLMVPRYSINHYLYVTKFWQIILDITNAFDEVIVPEAEIKDSDLARLYVIFNDNYFTLDKYLDEIKQLYHKLWLTGGLSDKLMDMIPKVLNDQLSRENLLTQLRIDLRLPKLEIDDLLVNEVMSLRKAKQPIIETTKDKRIASKLAASYGPTKDDFRYTMIINNYNKGEGWIAEDAIENGISPEILYSTINDMYKYNLDSNMLNIDDSMVDDNVHNHFLNGIDIHSESDITIDNHNDSINDFEDSESITDFRSNRNTPVIELDNQLVPYNILDDDESTIVDVSDGDSLSVDSTMIRLI